MSINTVTQANAGMGAGLAEAAKLETGPRVTIEMNILEKQFSTLKENVAELYGRLIPLMKVSEPRDGEQDKTPSSDLNNLANRINANTKNVLEVNMLVRNIISRLEI